MNDVGKRLKAIREERGMTQSGLAKEIGVQQSTINDIESGKTKRSKYLLTIAGVLNVDPDWLASGVGDIRGMGVEVVNQGAPLPLFDMHRLVDIAQSKSFDYPVVSMLYRCPGKHSNKAFTTVLHQDREDLKAGSVLFIEPVSEYKNGDCVISVFPDSKMVDLRMFVSDGTTTYLKSLDVDLDPSVRLKEFSYECVGGGELFLPQRKSKSLPKAIILGRLVFVVRTYD